MKRYLFYILFSFTSLASKAHVQRLAVDSTKPDSTNYIFTKVEIEADFPGGHKLWRSYLERNLNAMIPSDNFAPPGMYTVIAQFVVDKEGIISDVKPLTNHGFGMEEEVTRVIKKGPNWTPAILNGSPVRAYRKQPVTFMVIADIELSTYKIEAGKENIIEIKPGNLKPEDLEVTVSKGQVRHDTGNKYVVTVDSPGRIYFMVAKKSKKNRHELLKVAIEVK